MLDRLRAQHQVERAVVEWQRRVRLQVDDARARQPAPRSFERRGRHVGGGQLGRIELGAQAAVAAAEVERAIGVTERAHELSEHLGRRPGLLGNELPELVVEATRAQVYQAPRARNTAGIVLSRMVRSRNTDQRSR